MSKKNDFIKNFGKVFSEAQENSELIAEDKRTFFCDNTAILGVIPKTKEFDLFFKSNFETAPLPMPKIEGMQTMKISTSYLELILNICKNYKYIELSIKENNPLKIETPDFVAHIAPCTRDDD